MKTIEKLKKLLEAAKFALAAKDFSYETQRSYEREIFYIRISSGDEVISLPEEDEKDVTNFYKKLIKDLSSGNFDWIEYKYYYRNETRSHFEDGEEYFYLTPEELKELSSEEKEEINNLMASTK